jgi:glyoxylase-like metal-dependent hydrolase (beta-lactamase superfamily II)
MSERTLPDTNLYAYPHPITPALWSVGRGGWMGLPIGLSDADCNVYLLRGESFDVLIDCGGTTSLVKLTRNIRTAGSAPERIREIWLTHSHCDHSLRACARARRCPDTLCRISRLSIEYLHRTDYRLPGSFHPPRPRGFRLPSRLMPLQEGDRLRCPPWELRVEELPGHVPDQPGFRGNIDGFEMLFSGDAALGDQEDLKGMIGWIDGYWLSHLPTY